MAKLISMLKKIADVTVTLLVALLIFSGGKVVLGAPVAFATLDPRQEVAYPWKTKVIKYYLTDNFQQKQEFTLAANQWNLTKAGPRFVAVSQQGKANLVVNGLPRNQMANACPDNSQCIAQATFGYMRFRTSEMLVEYNEDKQSGVSRKYELAIAHELGHVLGLEHVNEPACSVMSQYGVHEECSLFTKGWEGGKPVYCGPYKTDVANLASIYHTAPNPNDTSFCMANWTDFFYNDAVATP